jgi:hypothetical protein
VKFGLVGPTNKVKFGKNPKIDIVTQTSDAEDDLAEGTIDDL